MAAAAAAALGVGAATPALAATGQNATGTLYANNAYCGGAQDTRQPVEGFVNFHHADPATIHLEYHLKDAQPNATYTVYLYEGGCQFAGTAGTVTTNSNGVGNLNADVPVNSADTSFFVFSTSGSQTVESVAVTAS